MILDPVDLWYMEFIAILQKAGWNTLQICRYGMTFDMDNPPWKTMSAREAAKRAIDNQ